MSHTAFSDLQYNLPANGKAVHSGTEQYLGVARSGTAPVGAGKSSIRADRDAEKGRVRREALPQQLLQKPDLIVVDPPRSGLGESASGALASLGAPRLTYVSCDPATLARDLVPLRVGGYSIEEMHLVDLFPQTYHLEAIVHLVR
jgi:23S rRNA (uracil1939-C5)-methyltransferase